MTDRTKHSAEEGWPEVAASLQSWLDALPPGPATPLQPPMTDPRLIALSSNPGQVEPGPFSEHDLSEQWNAQADEFNQWESLDSSEQLAWAQTRAINSGQFASLTQEPTAPIAWCRSDDFRNSLIKRQSFNGWREQHPDCDMALYAQPQAGATAPDADQAEGPSLADVDWLCAEFGFHYDDDESQEILHNMITAAITRWRAPVAQPVAAPAPQEPDVDHILRLAAIIRTSGGVKKWGTSGIGGLWTAGVGGGTGNPGDLIVVDDPIKSEVDGKHDLGAAALAEALLAHPEFSGCHDGPAALPAQKATQPNQEDSNG
jgi:hypothetical protein